MAAASGRRPSVVAVVLEGSGSDDDERAAETAQEVLTDDVDVDMTIGAYSLNLTPLERARTSPPLTLTPWSPRLPAQQTTT